MNKMEFASRHIQLYAWQGLLHVINMLGFSVSPSNTLNQILNMIELVNISW